MQTRTFGSTGREVSELGYGMWGLAGWTGSDDDEVGQGAAAGGRQRLHVLRHRLGLRRRRRASRILGRLVRANPDRKLYTATKVPPKNRVWPSRRGSAIADVFPPEYIREYALRSLENLGLDRVDLLQFHVWEDAWADDAGLAGRGLGTPRRGAHRRRRGQHQPLGALERPPDARDRALWRGAGDLQHLRPGARGRALPGLPRARHRRHRAGPLRRRLAHRPADEGVQLARG